MSQEHNICKFETISMYQIIPFFFKLNVTQIVRRAGSQQLAKAYDKWQMILHSLLSMAAMTSKRS